jgi:signal transduction histidine kinase
VLLSATSGEGEYTIEVRDSGPGIPSAARARLFDRFYRVRREPPAEPGADGDGNGGGAGLGLAIARWIAESHGGAIALTRSDQHGSTFRVQLPAGGVTESTTPRG